ncbi:MAG: bacteriohemerythrin [Holophaga sp.]|nr:bacteriohemerythrin [Holophaga sp.]
MPFCEFTDDLRVGHETIDHQHAALYETVNRLNDALKAGRSRQEMVDILAFLRTYTVDHFQAEETLMRETGYPGLEAHHALHKGLVHQVLELEEKYAAGTMILSIMTMHFLKDWLTNHIQDEDRKLAAYLRSK